ncbi:MAG TPA: hypothetical protein VFQ65_17055 [Kofleriaceae bacterium]|nr:hypothetical protein [Kofleriaceae bacterium]
MRSLAVIAFIALVAVTAGLAAQRRTVARGEVMAADLLASNKGVLTGLSCDPEIPIGVDGAQFWCDVVFARGGTRRLHFQLARTGQIKQIGEDPHKNTGVPPETRIDKSDPWQ